MGDKENRLRKFKNAGKDSEERRALRTETTVELRKNKKEEQLMKRRNVESVEHSSPLSPIQQSSGPGSAPTVPEKILDLSEIVQTIDSSEIETVIIAVRSTRRLLSRERNPPIDNVIKSGIIPSLVKYLQVTDNAPLQFEAAWAITNIASGTQDQTLAVVKAGAIPAFVALLASQHPNVVEQAVWALGNIAGDGAKLRDQVTEAGAVAQLMILVDTIDHLPMLRNITWTISNLCRNKDPAPNVEVIRQLLPTLRKLLSSEDKDIVIDACWALSYITDSTDDRIQLPLEAGVLPRLITLLNSTDAKITTPALRTVGNIVTGNDDQTQAMIDGGGLNSFHRLLAHTKNNIVKEAAWAMSNITAGNTTQIQAFLDAGLLPLIIKVLDKGDFKSQKEAAWVVTNLSTGGEVSQVLQPVQAGVVGPYCNLLDCGDVKVIKMVLDGIRNFLQSAKAINQLETMTQYVEECGALDKIENLQYHENADIYKCVYELLEDYFCDEEDAAAGADAEVAADGALTLNAPAVSEVNGGQVNAGFSF
jgi:importin subunit alpha-2